MNVKVGECDDGDINGATNCKSDCSGAVTGYTCAGGNAVTAMTCTSTCGDGIKTTSEVCDDGNTNSNDGCSNVCVIESGYTCNTLVSPNTCSPIKLKVVCGDGKNMIGEACDDGDVSSTTNCKGDCSGPALGYTCSGGSTTTPKTCVETCGEGIRTASE